MTANRLRQLLGRWSQSSILVVGDVMLDQFIWGKVSRISPEAPVPVVEVNKESFFPGGAANVARNLVALGVPVRVAGVVGDDPAGATIRSLLDEQGAETSGLIVDPTRETSLKTRIVAHQQQMVRFDRETTAPISPATSRKLGGYCRDCLAEVDAVIFEDYGKGVLAASSLRALPRLAQARGKITAADPSPRQPMKFTGLSVITPNRQEAFAAAGESPSEPMPDVLADQPLLKVGARLLRKWKPANLLITLGEHGMCLFRPGKRPHHIPTVAREVYDVSGAGDTVIATLTAALAAGARPAEAAELSTHAASVVVGKVGTAICTREELAASFRRQG